jgi:hypothetical protein
MKSETRIAGWISQTLPLQHPSIIKTDLNAAKWCDRYMLQAGQMNKTAKELIQ